MVDRPGILIDLNIISDVLQNRRPFYDASAKVLAAAETGKIGGYIAAHGVTALFYLIQKERGTAQAKASITNLLQIFKIAQIDQTTIEQALNLETSDFEDAVQMMAAVQYKLKCVVIRIVKDYQPPLLPVIQPVDFINSLFVDNRSTN